VLLLASGASFGCVPEGPPTTFDAGALPPPPPKVVASTTAPKVKAPSVQRPAIQALFEDNFDRAELGQDWSALGAAWAIKNGRLCGRGAKNKGVWLIRKLPVNARIEVDAFAEAAEGDLKVELWGDGVSGATGTSYNNATSYLAILGGWSNRKHVLARLDEHGGDRLEIDVDPNSDDERARPVSVGQPYHFKVERADGKTVDWSVNGLSYFTRVDPDPLVGAGHEYLGFNDWEAPVCFDNLKVLPL